MGYKTTSTDCIIEGLEISLKCNNFRYDSQNLLQLKRTATGTSNSCSFAESVVFNLVYKTHFQFSQIFRLNKALYKNFAYIAEIKN